jgi:CRISPR-associated protein Cas6
MFWQEETSKEHFQVPSDVVDVAFNIDCRELPVDHAYALSNAIRVRVPWIEAEGPVGIHTVHVAGSQNGWERPEHGTGNRILLSRRTKLVVRVPAALRERLTDELQGADLEVDGCPLKIGEAKVRPLSKQSTLFARYVVDSLDGDENAFLQWAVDRLREMDIRVRKALCGKTTPLATPDGMLHTRSLMLADLTVDESVRLQQQGLGSHRHLGCGIFIPHKGIDAVKKIDDD